MLKYDGLPIPDYESFYELFISQYCDSPKSLGIFYGDYALLQAIYNHPELNFDEAGVLKDEKEVGVLDWLNSNDSVELNSYLFNGFVKKVYIDLDYTTDSDPINDAYEQDKKKEHAWSIKFDDFAIKLFADTRVRAEYLAKMEHKKFCESKGADENCSIIKSIKECDDIGYGQKSTEAKTEQTQSIWVLAINSEMTAESTTLLFSTEAAARERLLGFYDDEFDYLDWENSGNPTIADIENKKRNSFTAFHNYDNNTYVDYVVYKQEIDSNGD